MDNSNHRIALEGAPNVRDLGGYSTKDGRSILTGRLLRGGGLYSATQKDIGTLKQKCHLGTIVDFRTDFERMREPDPYIEGVREYSLPVLDEETVGITREEGSADGFFKQASQLKDHPSSYMENLYSSLVSNPQAARQYGKFIDVLCQTNPRAVLWHCSAGKDRAGIGTAIVLTALGVEWETVMLDYLATNEFLKDETEQMVIKAAVFDDSPAMAKSIRVLGSVQEAFLESAFSKMSKEAGSVEVYLEKWVGISPAKKAILMKKYLV